MLSVWSHGWGYWSYSRSWWWDAHIFCLHLVLRSHYNCWWIFSIDFQAQSRGKFYNWLPIPGAHCSNSEFSPSFVSLGTCKTKHSPLYDLAGRVNALSFHCIEVAGVQFYLEWTQLFHWRKLGKPLCNKSEDIIFWWWGDHDKLC